MQCPSCEGKLSSYNFQKPWYVQKLVKTRPGQMFESDHHFVLADCNDAAVNGVLEGEYSPLEFRFFVGCREYKESTLDVAVHLGKYQPIA